jgi:hypothetical protein
LNNCNTSAILDTGSTFSLIPYSIWQKLNINKNQLDQSVQFNINSASHSNPDAVLGRIYLNITVKNKHGVEQNISQNCLILRSHLDLSFVLLGNDFFKENSVNISYHSSNVQPLISINTQEVTLLSGSSSDQSYFLSSCLALTKKVVEPPSPPTVPNPIERMNIPMPISDPIERMNIPTSISDPFERMNIPKPISDPIERMNIPTPISDPIECMNIPTPVLEPLKRLNIPSPDLPTADQLFHPDLDTNIEDITSFLQECKISKYKNYQQDLKVYSMQPVSLENMIEQNFEKKSIIPEAGLKNPTTNLSHLSSEIKQRL